MAMMPPMLAPGAMPPGPPGLADPSMMGGMLGPQFPSLDPNIMGQAMAPVMGLMQQDKMSLEQQQMTLMMSMMEQLLAGQGAPNPAGFAAQTAPAMPPVAPDMATDEPVL